MVYEEGPLHHGAVGGEFIAGLEVDQVPHHHVADVDFTQGAGADDFYHLLGFLLLLQGGGLALLLALADGGHAVGNEDGDEDAHWLKPLCLPQAEQNDLDHQGGQEDHNHRVLEALQELLPQWVRGELGQGIAPVLFSACFYLLG